MQKETTSTETLQQAGWLLGYGHLLLGRPVSQNAPAGRSAEKGQNPCGQRAERGPEDLKPPKAPCPKALESLASEASAGAAHALFSLHES